MFKSIMSALVRVQRLYFFYDVCSLSSHTVGAVAFKDRLRPNALRMVKLLQRLAAPHCDVWLCTSKFFSPAECVFLL